MKFKFYEYEKCSTCVKARKWLDQRNIQFQRIPIREHSPSKEELSLLLKTYDGEIRKLFNTSSKDYRDPVIKNALPGMSEREVFSMLIKNGNLIKRPVLVGDEIILQGFKPEVWEKQLG